MIGRKEKKGKKKGCVTRNAGLVHQKYMLGVIILYFFEPSSGRKLQPHQAHQGRSTVYCIVLFYIVQVHTLQQLRQPKFLFVFFIFIFINQAGSSCTLTLHHRGMGRGI